MATSKKSIPNNENSTTNSKMSKFVAATKQRMEENSDSNTPVRNERKAEAALKGQIASLNSKLVNDEAALEEAQEAMENAIYPSHAIGADSSYIIGIQAAQKRLDTAQEEVEKTVASITYYQNILETKF